MKRLISIVIAISGLSSASLCQTIKVKIEDQPVSFDASPITRDRTVMVPIRSMVTALTATFKWDPAKQLISVWYASNRFDVTLNSRQASANGKQVWLEEAPFVLNGRVFVPLKFVADSTGHVISQENGWLVLRASRKPIRQF